MREANFVIALTDSRYAIEILVVVVTGIGTALRWLELQQSDKKQTAVQRVATICTVLVLFLGALTVIVHRTESIATRAKDANQVTQVTQNSMEIADSKRELARAARNRELRSRAGKREEGSVF